MALDGFKDVDIHEAQILVQHNLQNNDFIPLDVRTPEEFVNGHIYNATNVDYFSREFREEIHKFKRGKTYLIYCRSGKRSKKALDVMKELGFTKLYHMKDGILHWINNGLPIAQEHFQWTRTNIT